MAHITVSFKSMALMRAVNIHVFLPTDGFAGTPTPAPYKTLYFLNGFSSSAQELIDYLPFRRQGELKHLAIVMPDGDNAFYIDHPERLTNYSTFVAKELVEFTRSIFPLSHKREDTYIGGISMGGYGALRNGLLYTDTFGKIAAMSPAVNTYRVWHDAPDAGFNQAMLDNLFGSEEQFVNSDLSPEYTALHTDKSKLPELFLCCGTEDPLVYGQSKDFVASLTKAGIPITYKEGPGAHETDYWEGVMDAVFSFLAGVPEGTKNRLLCDLG